MNKKGFTLVEILISIALMAVLSVMMIKLFIQADNFNQKAYELDKSVIMTQNILELMTAYEDPITEAAPLYNLKWNASGDEYSCEVMLDERFEVADVADASYRLNIEVVRKSEVQQGKALFEIQMDVERLKALPLEDHKDKSVYQLKAVKYLKDWM